MTATPRPSFLLSQQDIRAAGGASRRAEVGNEMRFATLIILAGCLVALAAAQEPKPATDTDRKIEQLIEQLGSGKFRVREAAAKELLALGKRAIPALRKAQRSTDPDVRLRAQLLLNEIGSGVPNLIEELSDKDPKVRQAA